MQAVLQVIIIVILLLRLHACKIKLTCASKTLFGIIIKRRLIGVVIGTKQMFSVVFVTKAGNCFLIFHYFNNVVYSISVATLQKNTFTYTAFHFSNNMLLGKGQSKIISDIEKS